MVIKTTRWYPDTCNCILEYTWEDPSPEDTRIHTPARIIQKCPAHENLNTLDEIYDTVLVKENQRKNFALQTALDNGPSTLFDIQGQGRVLKKDLNFTWSFSGTAPDRVITINFPGVALTNQQKNLIKTALDNKFGIGKVVLP